MIDIKNPDQDFGRLLSMPRNRRRNVFVLIGLLAVVLIGLALFFYWLVSPNRTINISEGVTYEFKGYSLTVDKVFVNICPTVPNFNCKNWVDEQGAQIHFTSKNSSSSTYGFLGLTTSKKLEEQGLGLELLSVDLQSKRVKIKMSVK